ncbi:MAG: methyltransferase domain-containing protein [Patescibacteria group bacterium]|jgi:ubiquinone/menaquinone biosynthesis C-methylase UbiE
MKEKNNPTYNSPEGIIGNAPFDKSPNANDSWAEEQPTTYDSLLKTLNSPEGKGLRSLIEGLKGDEKLVDLGSGLGSSITKILVDSGKIKDPIYLDLDKKNLSASFASGKEVIESNSKINADAKEVPLKDESIDIIVSILMMGDNEVNKEEKKLLIQKEIERILKNDGLVITNNGVFGHSEIINEENFEKIVDFRSDRLPLVIFRKKLP